MDSSCTRYRVHLLRSATFLLCVALAACASRSHTIATPQTYIGTVTAPRHTDWFLDHCNGGRLVLGLPQGCIQMGGGIQRVTVLNLRTEEGHLLRRGLIIGLPSSGLVRDYSARMRLQLVEAPEDFRKATGIRYVARQWSHL